MRNLAPLLVSLFLALPAMAQPQVKLDSEDDKVIYTMGVSMGRSLLALGMDEREIQIMTRGMHDELLGRSLAVDFDTYGPKMNQVAAERKTRVAQAESGASQAFLADAAAAPGAVKTDSGLIYLETKKGDGPQPQPTDTVTVHYRGTLRDGTVFDSSRERGEPATFPLNRVIPCWSEALQLMRVGGQANIVCPAELAYGDRGFGAIKPGAVLRFEVELLSIQ